MQAPSGAATYTLPAWAAVIDPRNAIAEVDEGNNNSPNPVTTVVTSLPDLTVQTSGPIAATAGTPYSYTLTAANTNGTSSASGVSLQLTLPSGVTYNSATVSNSFSASQSGGVVTFSGGSLAIGASATLTVSVTAASTGTITLPAGAAVIDPGNAISESNETNNSSTTVVTTSVRSTVLPQANNDSYTVGTNAPYTVSAAQGVLANDVGSPLTFITNTNPSNGSLSLNPDGSFTYTPNAGFTGTDSFQYTVSDAVQLYKTNLPPLATIGGVNITAGGYGSAVAAVPGSTDEYYGLTDRGPNVDGINDSTLVEPIPTFDPSIGKFKFVNGVAVLEQVIPLKAADGTPYSGRINSQNPTGEGTITDINGNVLPTDPNGYDSEGLVAMADGTFWVSDEYGPFITHFDASGIQIGRLSPFDGSLPAELQYRVANKGMEGLTITPDGSMLVGMMQSSLQAPDLPSNFDPTKEIPLRITTYQLTGPNQGQLHEYLYMLDSNADGISEITAVTNSTFIVDERDGKLPGQGGVKKLYLIDLTGATDVGPTSTVANSSYNGGAGGLRIGGQTIESLVRNGNGGQNAATATATLESHGITPVAKSLYLDLGGLLTTLDSQGRFFAHDKVEGVAVLNGGAQLVISNDSDFGIDGITNSSAPFQLDEKLAGNGQQDDGEYLVVDMTRLPAIDSTATVTFTVPPNTAPSFSFAGDQTVDEDAGPQTVSGFASGSTGPAYESGQHLSYHVSVSGTTGSLAFASPPAIDTAGNLTYQSTLNSNGSATVSVYMSDDGGTANGGSDTSAAQTFTITVNPVNDKPNADGKTVTTDEDTSAAITLSGSDVETPSSSLIFTVTQNPAHGILSGSGANLTYTPNANYNGSDSFLYTVTDTGDGPSPALTSDAATVSITVTSTPVTTATLTGTMGDHSWYTSPVKVTLSAADSLSPIAHTYYSLDGGSFKTYHSAFTVSDQGIHTVAMYSVDTAGTQETIHSITFKIDSVAPTTTDSLSGTLGNHNWYLSSVQVTLTPSDATSGVGATYYSLDGGSPTLDTGAFAVDSDGRHKVAFYSVDVAGNTEATKTVRFKIDTQAPVSTAILDGTLGNNGWYTSDVRVTLKASDPVDSTGRKLALTASDGGSCVAQIYYSLDGGALTLYHGTFTVSESGKHTITYYSVDQAGNVEKMESDSFKIA